MLQLTPELIRILRSQQAKADLRAKIKVEARKRERRLHAEHVHKLATTIIPILKAGEPTHFAFEAACRHGLRVTLVVNGWNWSDADAAAADVVSTSLRIIGAERPTWAEGQINITGEPPIERFYCSRCGDPIPDERKRNGRPVKFCSDLCSTAASLEKSRLSGERMALADWLARQALRKKQVIEERSGNCEVCSTPFITDRPDMRFCSSRCASFSRRTRREKPCEVCGVVFKAKTTRRQGEVRFCSNECRAESMRKALPDRECRACHSLFAVRDWNDKRAFCSPACNPRSRKADRPSTFTCEAAK